MKKRTRIVSFLVCVALLFSLEGSCLAATGFSWTLDGWISGYTVDYANTNNWAYAGYGDDQEVDVFFIGPTVLSGSTYQHNLDLYNSSNRSSLLAAINLERDIYAETARFYSPYYRQVCFNVYSMTDTTAAQTYHDLAYEDVRAAFLYYMTYWNDGRPLILAGFSQGASLCLRLMEEFFGDEELADQLVACYAIGWPVTQEMVDTYPQIQVAQGESDTGVVISYNSEATYITSSTLVPEGTKALSINPLNWKTDSTYADKSENLGACFCNPETGEVQQEYANFTGAYIDPVRGTLKVTDADPNTYTAYISNNADGVFHIFDFIFFYRNLQENVAVRTAAYLAKTQ